MEATTSVLGGDIFRCVDLLARIRWCAEHRADSVRQLSIKAGLSPGGLQKILERESARVGPEKLRAIAIAAGVSERWLILGEGSPDATDEGPSSTEDTTPVMANVQGYDDAERAVRQLHPEWEASAFESARQAAPYMVTGPVTVIQVEELVRTAIRLGGGGGIKGAQLRDEIEQYNAKLDAEIARLRAGGAAPPPVAPGSRKPKRGGKG